MSFNLYAIPNIICTILCIFMGISVYLRKRSNEGFIFLLLTISTAIWQLGTAFVVMSNNTTSAIYWSKFCQIGVTFIPIFTLHFIAIFTKYYYKIEILIHYFIICCIVIPTIILTNYIVGGVHKYFWGFWLKGGILHPFFLIYFVSLMFASFWKLYKNYKNEKSNLGRARIKFLFFAFCIAYIGAVDYLPDYGIEFYPFGYLTIILYLFIVAYAIVKYRLMDIRVAITRTGLFILIYTFVLGLPFVLASNIVWRNRIVVLVGSMWWTVPLGLMAVLATLGPFIYIFLNSKAEERLLKDQRRYQNILKEASLGMTRIRDLKRLLNLITHIVTKSVKISYIGIYLYHRDSDEFLLEVSRDKGRVPIPKLTPDNHLITWINLKRQPLIYEEVKRQAQDSSDPAYKQLEENMRALTASVILPSFLEDRFLGFIVLGEKMSGQIYTEEDLNVFQVLASQAALAIENAQFYNEAKEMQLQIAQAEKMATIGTMADGLSHQINNRFYALSLIAGDSMDTLKLTNTSNCSPEVKEMLGQISHALERIQANVMQGSEVVKGMLKYSRTGSENFEALNLDEIIEGTLEMVQFKVKLSEIDIVRDYPKETPQIHGNLAQLEEVFFNFIDNAYDAIVERRTTLKEEGFRGRVTISAHPKDSKLEITIEDNGMGVKDDDNRKLFTPFFTTKSSARTKGTGLGLYVINKIITEAHKGKIVFESDYKVGTRFIVELPLAK